MGLRYGGFSFPTTGGRLLLDPEAEPGGGGTPTEDVNPVLDNPDLDFESGGGATSAPADTPSVADLATTQPAATNAAPSASPAGATAPAASDTVMIRDALAQLGYNLPPNIQDDHDALTHLIRQADLANQQNFYAQLGQQLAPHAQDFLAYRQQQQQRPAAQAERPAWEPPPFDPRWAHLVQADQNTGLFVGKPGTPPEIVKAVNDYAKWRDDFSQNPAAFIQPMVESRAQAIAEQAINQRFGQLQAQQSVDRISAEIAPWFYQRGTDQQPVRDAWGRPQPSPAGARYLSHVQNLIQAGVRDVNQQHYFAMNLLQAELSNGAAPARPTVPTAAQARPNANPLQAAASASRDMNANATDPSMEGMSLTEMMRHEFKQNSVTDDDFAPVGF